MNTKLEDKYKEETGFDVGRLNIDNINYYSEDYVEWLEKQLPIYGVVRRSEQLECDNGCDWYRIGHQLNGHQQCRKCGKQKAF